MQAAAAAAVACSVPPHGVPARSSEIPHRAVGAGDARAALTGAGLAQATTTPHDSGHGPVEPTPRSLRRRARARSYRALAGWAAVVLAACNQVSQRVCVGACVGILQQLARARLSPCGCPSLRASRAAILVQSMWRLTPHRRNFAAAHAAVLLQRAARSARVRWVARVTGTRMHAAVMLLGRFRVQAAMRDALAAAAMACAQRLASFASHVAAARAVTPRPMARWRVGLCADRIVYYDTAAGVSQFDHPATGSVAPPLVVAG